ncbi:MAG: outer membrane beta-barrel protein [Pseudomonadota bacterium]
MIFRMIAPAAIVAALFQPAIAQPSEVSSNPSPYFSAPNQATPAAALPRGRSQSQNQAPRQRQPRYAGGTVPNTSSAYRSRAYPGATPDASAVVMLPGGRVEARLGWDRVGAAAPDTESNTNGVVYGLGVGYDRRFGNYFVGAFASIDSTSGTAENVNSVDVVDGTTTRTFQETVEHSFKRDIEIGVRAGYHFSKYIRAYGSAAIVNLKSNISTETVTIEDPDNTDNVPGTPSEAVVSGADQFQDGWRLGVGSEIEVLDGVYAKAEYRYSDYGEDEQGLEITRHQVITGVGLRF